MTPEAGLVAPILAQGHNLGLSQFCLAGLPCFFLVEVQVQLFESFRLSERLDRLGMAMCKSRRMRKIFRTSAAVCEHM